LNGNGPDAVESGDVPKASTDEGEMFLLCEKEWVGRKEVRFLCVA
jgi:hypothetical protein